MRWRLLHSIQTWLITQIAKFSSIKSSWTHQNICKQTSCPCSTSFRQHFDYIANASHFFCITGTKATNGRDQNHQRTRQKPPTDDAKTTNGQDPNHHRTRPKPTPRPSTPIKMHQCTSQEAKRVFLLALFTKKRATLLQRYMSLTTTRNTVGANIVPFF